MPRKRNHRKQGSQPPVGGASAPSQSNQVGTNRRGAQTRKQGDGRLSSALVYTTGLGGQSVGAAIANNLVPRAGMSDIMRHRFAWLVGQVYVGNGTLGTTDQVYFEDRDANLYTYLTPISPGDPYLGESYVTDVIKHYARKRVLSIRLYFVPEYPSTSNSMLVNLAPYRGGNFVPTITTSTTGAPSVAGVLGMQDNLSFTSWQSAMLDLTPYVAGGNGPSQNEFNMSASAAEESSPSAASNSLDVPCGFCLTGTNGTSGLRGLQTHLVIAEITMDLMDYIGGITPSGVEMRPGERLRPSRPAFDPTALRPLRALVEDSAGDCNVAAPAGHGKDPCGHGASSLCSNCHCTKVSVEEDYVLPQSQPKLQRQ